MHRIGTAAWARLVHAGFAAVALCAATAYLLGGRAERVVVYTVVVAVPTVTWVAAVAAGHLRDRRPWIIATTGLFLLLALQLHSPHWIAEPHLGQAEGSLDDAVMASAHTLFLAGVAMALRRRAGTDPGGIIDASLFGLCAGGPLWVWVVQPHLPATAPIAGQMMLLTEILVMCAVTAGLIRIGTSGGAARATIAYFVLTAVLTLAGIVVADLAPGGVGSALLVLTAYLTMAAGPVHPGAPAVTVPPAWERAGTNRPRLGWLGAALCVDPMIAAMQAARGMGSASLLLPIGSLMVIPLVVLRIRQLTVQRDRAETTLAHHATHDELTGLYNRRHIRAVIEKTLDAGGGELTVLLCDLDRFKPINDEYGHSAGDEVLQEVGRRMSGAVRDGDLVGRLGGDEFVVLCPGLPESDAHDLVERIRAAVNAPITLTGGPVTVGVSIGVAHARPGFPAGRDALIAEADAAMYAGKSARRSTAVT